jgi:NAD(P)-dependent dehydrogenase (short-subunit alcohol dehydrogenase family)
MVKNEFKDKVVLITGAGRGLGRAIAEAFAARQAIVAVNDLTPINLDVTLERITLAGGRVKDYVFDVSKKMAVQTLVDLVLTDWGRIDILVNHAVVRPRAALLTMDEWDWQRTLDVNLTGPFLTLQRVGQVMRHQGGGVVVNIASTMEEARDWVGQAAFVASQTGLIGLTRQAAEELAGDRIRLNAVCAECTAGGASPADYQLIVDQVMFLCSDASMNISGQIIPARSANDCEIS